MVFVNSSVLVITLHGCPYKPVLAYRISYRSVGAASAKRVRKLSGH